MDMDGIYQAYFKDVYLYMCGLSGNESIAEEIAQETFAKALKSLDSFDGRKDIRAWLFTIAKNTYFTYCKRKKIFNDNTSPEEMPDASSRVVERMIDQEMAFQVHQYLHQMKEPYKEVFLLRVFGELPFEKIGLLFGKSASWARVTYYRAKVQIQDYMEGLNHE